jgi:hypothetical protein
MNVVIYLLHLIVINVSKVSSFREHLSDLYIFPAILNMRSTEAEMTGIVRYLNAALANDGNLKLLSFQNSRTLSFISVFSL